jgi:hypothetical protein
MINLLGKEQLLSVAHFIIDSAKNLISSSLSRPRIHRHPAMRLYSGLIWTSLSFLEAKTEALTKFIENRELETMNILSKEQKLLIHSLCIEINTSFF